MFRRARGLYRTDRARRALIPLVCFSQVRPGARLVLNEWLGRTAVARYRRPRSGLVVHLRQPRLDLWVLEEIFQRGTYEYPAEVRDLLDGLERPPVVVDLGACAGLAGIFFLERWPGARMVAFEPDAANRSVLEKTINANGLAGSWTVVAACAATEDGTISFVSRHFLSHVDPDGTAPGATRVPAVDVFPHLADADVVKMDLQGSEWALLTDPRFAAVPLKALVVEYHPFLAPSADPSSDIVRILEAAGYRCSTPADVHAGEGTVWAWREAS